MKTIAQRGKYRLLIQGEEPESGEDAPCVIEDTRTGKQWDSTIQTALKWGYWKPIESPSVLVIRANL